MVKTDVNAAFADERARQITAAYEARDRAYASREAAVTRYEEMAAKFDQRVKDGTLVPLGGNRFRVSDPGSWDNGETLTLRQPSPQTGEIPLLLPEHGLDEVDGKAQLFTAEPAWHSLGTVRKGVTDVDTLLDLGGIGFEVEQRAVRYQFGRELREVPDAFVNVRSDTGDPLGVVGRIYTPLQNRRGAEFLQELADRWDVQFESAGPLRGGRRVFISMRLPESVVIDAEGIGDVQEIFLAWLNSHDGSSPLQLLCTPWRPVCENTNRFAVRDAITRWAVRHTTNAGQRVDEARRALKLSLRYAEKFGEEETALARTEIQMKEFRELCESLWPRDREEESKRSRTMADRREGALEEAFAVETRRVGRTAYAAEQAVTGYLDHVAPRRLAGGTLAAARATAVLEGLDDDKKSAAHRKLLTLTR